MIGAIISGLVGAGTAIGSAVSARRRAQRDAEKQKQNQLDLMKQQHDYEVENYERQLKDERSNQLDLLKNKYKYEVDAMRKAGVSPTLAVGGGLGTSTPIDASSATSASATAPAIPNYGGDLSNLGGAIGDAIGISEMLKNNESTRELQKSQQDLNETNSEKVDLDNLFFRDSYAERLDKVGLDNEQLRNSIGLSKEDLWVKQQVNGYFAEHPDWIQAMAEKEKIINDNLQKQREVMEKNISFLSAQTKNVDQDTRVKAEQEIKTAIESAYTETQREYIMNKQWRENYNNPSWLINEEKRILHDDSYSIEEKIELGALCRQAYAECSGYASQSRQFNHDLEIQENELDFKYIELTQRGADSLINDFLTYTNNKRRNEYTRVANKRSTKSSKNKYQNKRAKDIFGGKRIK